MTNPTTITTIIIWKITVILIKRITVIITKVSLWNILTVLFVCWLLNLCWFLKNIGGVCCVWIMIHLVWNTLSSAAWFCRIFRHLFTIWDKLSSVKLYVTDDGYIFLVVPFFICEYFFVFQFYLLSWFVHLELALNIICVETSISNSWNCYFLFST